MRAITRAQVRRAFTITIRVLRKERGLSQEALARLAGVDRSYMGKIERGLNSPTIEKIYQLLPALGMTFEEFARRFDEMLTGVLLLSPKRRK